MFFQGFYCSRTIRIEIIGKYSMLIEANRLKHYLPRQFSLARKIDILLSVSSSTLTNLVHSVDSTSTKTGCVDNESCWEFRVHFVCDCMGQKIRNNPISVLNTKFSFLFVNRFEVFCVPNSRSINYHNINLGAH